VKKIIFLLCFALIAAITLAGCTSVAEVTSPTSSPPPMSTWAPGGTPTPTIFPNSTTPLTLEEARAQLAAKGWAAVDTKEKASQLAGYSVSAPSFIPVGFIPRVWDRSGIFMVNKPGFGAAPTRDDLSLEVDQYYSPNPDPKAPVGPYFVFIQSTSMSGMLGGTLEDIIINGHPGKKSLVAVSGFDAPPISMLGLHWGDGTVYYFIQGQLSGPLDEAALLKIAESVAP
jgi:hypothetical protein